MLLNQSGKNLHHSSLSFATRESFGGLVRYYISQAFYRQKSVNLPLIAKEGFLTVLVQEHVLYNISKVLENPSRKLTKNEFLRDLYCAAWKRGCIYCLLCCSSLKPRATWASED